MTDVNVKLRSLLKKKGVGASMGKHLSFEELTSLNHVFVDETGNLTTKATLLTAIIQLDKTEDEKLWFETLNENPSSFLSTKLIDFLPSRSITYHKNKDQITFLEHTKEMFNKKDLSKKVFKTCFAHCLDPEFPDYLKAAFLEAARLKRETFDENMATLEVLWSKSKRSKTKLPVLIDIASSYDGFDRNPGLMMFSACILAALGYPTLLHGVEKVGPKYGLTTHKLLNYFGKNPLKSMSYTLEDLEDPNVGWGYVDQSVYFPELFALQELRHDMVKRPVISTIEKILQPIQTKNGNHLITGYTHPGYKTMLSTILKEQKASPISLLVRGLEGSAQLPLDRQAPILTITKNDIADNFIRPSDFDIPEISYDTDLKFNEEFCMNEGLKALDNNTGPIRNMIIYNTASILFKFGLMDKKQILNAINTVLKNKSALDCFDNF